MAAAPKSLILITTTGSGGRGNESCLIVLYTLLLATARQFIKDTNVATPDPDQQPPRLPSTPSPLAAGQPTSPARRRFGRAGAAAAAGGVLATVKSSPGMACTICWTPSADQSMLIGKSHHAENNPCNGVPPSSWIASTSWPNNINRDTFKFQDAFTMRGTNTDKTMLALMQVGSDAVCAKNDYACKANRYDSSLSNDAWMMKYLCANFLNMTSKKMPFLTMEILNGIWTGWCTNSAYTPRGGAKAWGIADLKRYLSGTV